MKENRMPRRRYTEEFKIEAVRLAESVGGHEAARRLGLPQAAVGNWSGAGKTDGQQRPEEASVSVPRRSVTELEAENSRLRKELADARLDVEILRNATAYFAKGSR